jgi:succinate dehydrogenase/fumarate reductase cytochrome b subunit
MVKKRNVISILQRIAKTIGIFFGIVALGFAALFGFVLYTSGALAPKTSDWFENLNNFIISSPTVVAIATVILLVSGILVFAMSINYIPRGQGLKSWDEYFDDIKPKKRRFPTR